MSDPSTQLMELWKLSDEGKTEWWPNLITVGVKVIPPEEYEVSPSQRRDARLGRLDREVPFFCWTLGGKLTGISTIQTQHALDLVTAEAERWLDGKGWYLFADSCQGKSWCLDGSNPTNGKNLPEALTHVMNQQ